MRQRQLLDKGCLTSQKNALWTKAFLSLLVKTNLLDKAFWRHMEQYSVFLSRIDGTIEGKYNPYATDFRNGRIDDI